MIFALSRSLLLCCAHLSHTAAHVNELPGKWHLNESNGAINLVSEWAHKCLDLSGGSGTNGNLLQIWDCNGMSNQQWVFGSGTWRIQHAVSGKCIDALGWQGGSDGAGTKLGIWDCNGQNSQKWGYDSNMKTIYLAASDADASLCMDLAGGNANDGTSIQVWNCNGHSNQAWDVRAPGPSPPPPPGPSGSWEVVTLHWNIHWQCGQNSGSCQQAGLQRFGELVKESGAQIATAIELRGASNALSGWSASGEYEDAVSIMVAPGWTVHKRGGGQIQSGSGARGLAVMLVTPPQAVSGCPQLCVMGVHPGHSEITGGKSIVDGVCGDVANSCAIAMGDWNADANAVRGGSYNSWGRLVGGSPTVLAPNMQTCCVPHTCCSFDHAGTNIRGASEAGEKSWGYQLTDKFKMDEEHMPVSVWIRLPGGSLGTNASLQASPAIAYV